MRVHYVCALCKHSFVARPEHGFLRLASWSPHLVRAYLLVCGPSCAPALHLNTCSRYAIFFVVNVSAAMVTSVVVDWLGGATLRRWHAIGLGLTVGGV